MKACAHEQVYLFLTVGAEGEQGHGTVGSAAAGPGWHAVLGGLAGALAACFTTQGGGQILPDLLPLGLLDVVFGGILQVGLHLREQTDLCCTMPINRSFKPNFSRLSAGWNNYWLHAKLQRCVDTQLSLLTLQLSWWNYKGDVQIIWTASVTLTLAHLLKAETLYGGTGSTASCGSCSNIRRRRRVWIH